MFRLTFGFVVLVAVVFVAPALGGPIEFSGYYAPDNWTITNNGYSGPGPGSIDWSDAPGQVTLTGGWGGEAMTIIAPASGTVSISYDYSNNGDTNAGFWEWKNGTDVNITFPSASGTFSYTVTAGDRFGFDVGCWNPSSPASAVISNFDAPLATPEPASLALLGLGGLALFGMLRSRRRA